MIGQILTDVILANASIKALIGYDDNGTTRYAFSPNVVPQGVPLPAISYKVIGIDSVETKDEYVGIDKYRVQVDTFSTDYTQLEKLDGLVRNAFSTAAGLYTVTDFDDSSIQVDVGVSRHEETTEVYFEEQDTHGRSTEYSIIINRE